MKLADLCPVKRTKPQCRDKYYAFQYDSLLKTVLNL